MRNTYLFIGIGFLMTGGILLYIAVRFYGAFSGCSHLPPTSTAYPYCPGFYAHSILTIGMILVSIGVISLIIGYKRQKKPQLS